MNITQLTTPKHNGFSSVTCIIAADVAGDEHHWVVQLAPPAGSGLFADYDMARSFHVQQDLSATAVPVAKMLHYCADPEPLGQPFYVMQFVPGQVPPDRPCYHMAGWLAEAGAGHQAAVWRSGLAAMAALHKVDSEGFAYLHAADEEEATLTAAGHVAAGQLRHWLLFAENLTDNHRGDLRMILAALAELHSTAPGVQTRSIRWGDAKLGNMIFKANQCQAILDWELCGIGTPAEDLAHWFAVDWYLSGGIGRERLAGLPGKTESLDCYREVNDTNLASVSWWFSFALVRMALIFHRGNRDRPDALNPLVSKLPVITSGDLWDAYGNAS